VSNIVGDKAEVVPLIPAGFNPHAYEPRAEDIKRIGTWTWWCSMASAMTTSPTA
jgi:ABC-type Zn uptake system ZnuABC Zn-binding protein ZnuA